MYNYMVLKCGRINLYQLKHYSKVSHNHHQSPFCLHSHCPHFHVLHSHLEPFLSLYYVLIHFFHQMSQFLQYNLSHLETLHGFFPFEQLVFLPLFHIVIKKSPQKICKTHPPQVTTFNTPKLKSTKNQKTTHKETKGNLWGLINACALQFCSIITPLEYIFLSFLVMVISSVRIPLLFQNLNSKITMSCLEKLIQLIIVVHFVGTCMDDHLPPF